MTLTEMVQPVLDKKLPAALVAAILLQTAGALFWAGSAAERKNATLFKTITLTGCRPNPYWPLSHRQAHLKIWPPRTARIQSRDSSAGAKQ